MKTFIVVVIVLIGSKGYSQEVSAGEPGPSPTSTVYLAPLFSIGATFPNLTSTNGISHSFAPSYSLGLASAFYVSPGERKWKFAPVAEISLESRSVDFVGPQSYTSNLRINYLNFMPAIQYRGFFTLGINIGLPIHASSTVPISASTVLVTSLDRNLVKLLIEPKLLIGYPVAYFDFAPQKILAVFCSVGYPLNSVFKQDFELLDRRGNPVGAVTGLKLISVQAGICIAFAFYTYPKMR